VEEPLRKTIARPFEMSLILPRALSPKAQTTAVAAMQDNLPQEPVVLLVRARTDFDDLYVLSNGDGLWASTTRSELDDPIVDRECADGEDAEALRTQFLGGARTLDELIEALRR